MRLVSVFARVPWKKSDKIYKNTLGCKLSNASYPSSLAIFIAENGAPKVGHSKIFFEIRNIRGSQKFCPLLMKFFPYLSDWRENLAWGSRLCQKNWAKFWARHFAVWSGKLAPENRTKTYFIFYKITGAFSKYSLYDKKIQQSMKNFSDFFPNFFNIPAPSYGLFKILALLT